MIHFERPNTTGTGAGARGVVAVPPAGWVPNPTFDDQLLAGLATNPVVTPVTLDDFFTSVRDGGPRHLQSGGPGPTLPTGLSHQISTARLRLTDFDSVVRPRSTPVLTQLDQLLLAAEAANLSSAAQSAGVATFGRSLGAQLAQITFATEPEHHPDRPDRVDPDHHLLDRAVHRRRPADREQRQVPIPPGLLPRADHQPPHHARPHPGRGPDLG